MRKCQAHLRPAHLHFLPRLSSKLYTAGSISTMPDLSSKPSLVWPFLMCCSPPLAKGLCVLALSYLHIPNAAKEGTHSPRPLLYPTGPVLEQRLIASLEKVLRAETVIEETRGQTGEQAECEDHQNLTSAH